MWPAEQLLNGYLCKHARQPKSGQSVLLIKIDVEGFDVGVVHSAEGLIRANLLKHLIFEYTPYRNDQVRM